VRTDQRSVRPGPARAGGYRPLEPGPAEPAVVRTDLCSGPGGGRSLLSVAHLSDLHVCDAQSPARVEFLDRWADPDSPLLEALTQVGTYRAQELLTTQVVEAMVRAVNDLSGVDLAVVTGDSTDNAQANELGWYLALLEGGSVHPDSGAADRWEGVSDGVDHDQRFWHPSDPRPDLPRECYGLPAVPDLLDTARTAFTSAGLDVPWLAVHGNHDRMLQGTLPATGPLAQACTGSAKPVALPEDWSTDAALALLVGLEQCQPEAVASLAAMRMRPVTADAARRVVSRQEFIHAHFGPRAKPAGHGFGSDNRATSRAYYRHDHGRVSVLALDTVNHHGGWQGSLDLPQLEWLEAELSEADAERRYAVLASHHPLSTLVNDRSFDGSRRVLAAELAAVLGRHRSAVLWLNGHTHHTTVTARDTLWEVTAPSLIDWPQQARLVSLLQSGDGVLTIDATMVDHAGSAPWTQKTDSLDELAGLSRELAANDWQWRGQPLEQHPRAGTAADRNLRLLLADPWT